MPWFCDDLPPPKKRLYTVRTFDIIGLSSGPQRENFPGGTKVDAGPPNLIGLPKPYRGPMPLNHFLFDGCRSLFKIEGKAIFAYS